MKPTTTSTYENVHNHSVTLFPRPFTRIHVITKFCVPHSVDSRLLHSFPHIIFTATPNIFSCTPFKCLHNMHQVFHRSLELLYVEMVCVRNVSCDLSAFEVICSWLFNNRNYVDPTHCHGNVQKEDSSRSCSCCSSITTNEP